jgi:hypothetical protein
MRRRSHTKQALRGQLVVIAASHPPVTKVPLLSDHDYKLLIELEHGRATVLRSPFRIDQALADMRKRLGLEADQC